MKSCQVGRRGRRDRRGKDRREERGRRDRAWEEDEVDVAKEEEGVRLTIPSELHLVANLDLRAGSLWAATCMSFDYYLTLISRTSSSSYQEVKFSGW